MAKINRNIRPKSGPSRAAALTITHPNAAVVDIGSASHFVAVPPDRDDEPVREFLSFTADLHALADWLTACGVDIVAMESTGVYWIPLYELLESRGFKVLLVNARHVKNVSGRKSDGRSRASCATRHLHIRVQCAGLPVAATAHDLRTAQRGVPSG